MQRIIHYKIENDTMELLNKDDKLLTQANEDAGVGYEEVDYGFGEIDSLLVMIIANRHNYLCVGDCICQLTQLSLLIITKGDTYKSRIYYVTPWHVRAIVTLYLIYLYMSPLGIIITNRDDCANWQIPSPTER